MTDKTNLTMILYTDGGARPNPGIIGCGIHGYIYDNDSTEKQNNYGCEFNHSETGYVAKTDSSDNLVTPISYVDCFFTIKESASNNVAELLAANQAILIAIENNVKQLLIHTDSQYTVNIVTNCFNKEKDINESTPNYQHIKTLYKNIENASAMGIEIDIQWIESHSTHLGNVIADKLATAGINANREFLQEHFSLKINDPKKYWDGDVSKDPLISNKRMYFNSNQLFHKPGTYYLGDHGKEDRLLGSKGCYGIVKLKEPDKTIETLLSKIFKINSVLNRETINTCRLDKLFTFDIYNEIQKYNTLCLEQQTPNSTNLLTLDKEPISKELNPPLMAYNLVDSLTNLENILDTYISSTTNNKPSDIFTFVDITNNIYDKVQEKKKEVYKIKDELKKNENHLDIIIKIGEKDVKIRLVLSIDLPSKNSLVNLAKYNPVVSLVYSMINKNTIQYVTIIKTDNGYGIYSSFMGNIKII